MKIDCSHGSLLLNRSIYEAETVRETFFGYAARFYAAKVLLAGNKWLIFHIRAKRVTKTMQKVASGVLSGVVKVSGYFMTKLENSKSGKKLFNKLLGEILLASLDGFSKICDVGEVAGKNVLTTSSTVTSDLVTHRYGEEARQATDEGLDAVGHAFGTAWVGFKIRKALDPKNAVKATAVAKSAAKAAASDYKARKVSRSIGDAYLKRSKLNKPPLLQKFRLPDPFGKPILSTKPSILVQKLCPGDQFLIFASDGLWEHLSNQEAVDMVNTNPRGGIAKRLLKATMC